MRRPLDFRGDGVGAPANLLHARVQDGQLLLRDRHVSAEHLRTHGRRRIRLVRPLEARVLHIANFPLFHLALVHGLLVEILRQEILMTDMAYFSKKI